MPFLTDADYKQQVKGAILTEIIEGDTTIRIAAELAAQAEITSYLKNDFKVSEIFAATGAARNPMIMMYMIDLTLYHLLSRVAPDKIPELRINRYNQAIMWLDKVRSGKLVPDLPVTDIDTTPNTLIRTGSNTKFGSQF